MTILNTSILTAFGDFAYHPCSLQEAKTLANSKYETHSLQSAVGHQSTADILTALLGVPVPMNRIQYTQSPGEIALVFKLKGRPPEDVILTVEEMEGIGYEFGLLVMR